MGSSPGMLVFNAPPAFPILDEDDLSSDSATQAASQQSVKAYVDGGRREALTGNRTYYVDGGSGSDSNDGLSSGAGAFATIGKAMTVCGGLDCLTYNVTVSVAAGTYSEDVLLPRMLGSGTFTLSGAGSGSCTISGTTYCLRFAPGSIWDFGGFELDGAVYLLELNNAFGNMTTACDFGDTSADQIYIHDLATLYIKVNYTVTGGGPRHWRLEQEAIIHAYGYTITFNATSGVYPDYSGYFAYAIAGSNAVIGAMTFTNGGSVTGNRYFVSSNSNLHTFGGGATYLPGNAAGTEDATYDGGYT